MNCFKMRINIIMTSVTNCPSNVKIGIRITSHTGSVQLQISLKDFMLLILINIIQQLKLNRQDYSTTLKMQLSAWPTIEP